MLEINAILTIAYRDFTKFLRDRPRILATFIFPLLFIAILGTSFQSSLGQSVGFNFLTFTFTGVLAQTLFQSTAAGIISLIEDRESDFSQEMFVSPISRYSIITGKILGESLVALVQAVGIILIGLLFRVPMTLSQIIGIIPVGLVICFLGGAFGILVLANLNSQRSANQIFPFLIFPQYFLAGVFNPVAHLPLPLLILSRITPMTYAVDFLRNIFYSGHTDFSQVVVFNLFTNILVIAVMFFAFMISGTLLFVRNEKNR